MHLYNSLFILCLHLLGKQSTVAQVSRFLLTSQRADFLALPEMRIKQKKEIMDNDLIISEFEFLITHGDCWANLR